MYGRPHSADCAVNEHREIVAALRGRNAEAAIAVMDAHLGAVEHRALSDQGRDTQFDLGAVLSRYAEVDTGNAQGRAIAGTRHGQPNDRGPDFSIASFTPCPRGVGDQGEYR